MSLYHEGVQALDPDNLPRAQKGAATGTSTYARTCELRTGLSSAGSELASDDTTTSIGFFRSLVHRLNHAEFRTPRQARECAITATHSNHNMAFVRKGRNDQASFAGVGYPRS